MAADRPLSNEPWSSYGEHFRPPGKRAPWLRVDRFFGEMHLPEDSAAGRRQFEAAMVQRRSQETGSEGTGVERGWCVGDETFRQKLLAQAEGKFGANHYAGQQQESTDEKARPILAVDLRSLGSRHGELEMRLKANPDKVRIARRLRGETTVTLKWIAGELRMGRWTYLSNNLSKPTRSSPAQ